MSITKKLRGFCLIFLLPTVKGGKREKRWGGWVGMCIKFLFNYYSFDLIVLFCFFYPFWHSIPNFKKIIIIIFDQRVDWEGVRTSFGKKAMIFFESLSRFFFYVKKSVGREREEEGE